jgi:hypothetical protein
MNMQDNGMLSHGNMLTDMTVLHIQNTYFKFVVTTCVSKHSQKSKNQHMWAMQIQSMHFGSAVQSYLLAYLTYSHKCVADLLSMPLPCIFIILGEICHAGIFWTIGKIVVWSIPYHIFRKCRDKASVCIYLLSILELCKTDFLFWLALETVVFFQCLNGAMRFNTHPFNWAWTIHFRTPQAMLLKWLELAKTVSVIPSPYAGSHLS